MAATAAAWETCTRSSSQPSAFSRQLNQSPRSQRAGLFCCLATHPATIHRSGWPRTSHKTANIITSELNNTNYQPFELTDQQAVPVDRWPWAVKKDAMNRNTAGRLRAGCVQVVGILDDPDETYIEGVDIDDISPCSQDHHKQRIEPHASEAQQVSLTECGEVVQGLPGNSGSTETGNPPLLRQFGWPPANLRSRPIRPNPAPASR